MMKILKSLSYCQTFWLVLYYGFARYLPCSDSRLGRLFLAKKIRRTCCRNIFKYVGKNVNIERGAWFGRGGGVEIGDNSGIGINAHIYNNTIIGKNVMIGPNLYMLEKTHRFDRTDIPMIEQGFITDTHRDQVIIGDDVWIGRDVMIIGSREIKTGSIVGARCVLTKSFPEYSIIGGNPARLIRSRLFS